MDQWSTLGNVLGGLGLLLVGMNLLTEGLKIAAGRALHRLLAAWTSSRLRGLLAGVGLTAVVQSSSAVTAATIGFANAGLLTLPQAAWVVFGSNVGTTATAWIVAVVGLKLKVEALALPILGVGALVRVARGGTRMGGLGEALAGIGALFLGLDFLQSSFSGLSESVDLGILAGGGVGSILAGAALGAGMTVVMQSSSAALAIVLTAVSRGLVPLEVGAALVVGANVGTTSTALLATIGATPVARRVACLHVVFNGLTAGFALALLKPLLEVTATVLEATTGPADAATSLALFHTVFNVVGVLIMVPTAPPVIRFLGRRFVDRSEAESRPAHLDENVLGIPEVAVTALLLEARRLASMVGRVGGQTFSTAPPERLLARFESETLGLRKLLGHVGDYAVKIGRHSATHEATLALVDLVRIQQRLATMMAVAQGVAGRRRELELLDGGEGLDLAPSYLQRVAALLAAADVTDPAFDLARLEQAERELSEARRAERARVLAAAASGKGPAARVSLLLQISSDERRFCHQAEKVAIGLHGLGSLLAPGDPTGGAGAGAPPPAEPAAAPTAPSA